MFLLVVQYKRIPIKNNNSIISYMQIYICDSMQYIFPVNNQQS